MLSPAQGAQAGLCPQLTPGGAAGRAILGCFGKQVKHQRRHQQQEQCSEQQPYKLLQQAAVAGTLARPAQALRAPATPEQPEVRATQAAEVPLSAAGCLLAAVTTELGMVDSRVLFALDLRIRQMHNAPLSHIAHTAYAHQGNAALGGTLSPVTGSFRALTRWLSKRSTLKAFWNLPAASWPGRPG